MTPLPDHASSATGVLVAGGAGYIGSHTVRALQSEGYRVVVLDNLSTGHRASVPDDIPLLQGQIGNTDLLRRILKDHAIDSVMHFCAHAYVGESVTHPSKYYGNNIAQGLGLLNAMRAEGVSRLIFSSSCTVYGIPATVPIDENSPTQPISPYGRTKWMFEKILADYETAYSLRWTALRYFNAAGACPDGSIGEDHDPETHLIPLVLRQALAKKYPQRFDKLPPLKIFGDDYPTPDGTCIRDYVHVTDLANAHVAALKRLIAGEDSLTANLGTGCGTSVQDVIETCKQITGLDISAEIAPRRSGDPPELVASANLARKELAWTPECSDIENIIRTAWRWHTAHPAGFE